MFTVQDLLKTDQKPAPYETGDEFWNDPYISRQLLQAHLDDSTNRASYKPQTIGAICAFLPAAMGLSTDAAIADLGCGPGLYCARLSELGYAVTGVDRSEHSLDYAREHAPQARFIRQSYLEPLGAEQFDAAIMISQDFGVLSPENRKTLLNNIHAALKPGGRFAFDVPSLRAFQDRTAHNAPNWYAAGAGLFRPHPHFVLEKPFAYPELPALCDTYAVFDSEIKRYRFWQTFYSPDTIRAELESCGFQVAKILSDLTGKEYTDDSETLGVICQKV
jgi:SAM-dependent methyltransferase